jgi:hypothetical protein
MSAAAEQRRLLAELMGSAGAGAPPDNSDNDEDEDDCGHVSRCLFRAWHTLAEELIHVYTVSVSLS